VTDSRRFEPVTEEEKEEARRAIEQLKRDLAESAKRPKPPVYSPGKFTEPLGLDADGNLQPPLTREEAAHNEAVRRRARGEAAADEAPRRRARGEAADDEE
jgi:hypothetical protein